MAVKDRKPIEKSPEIGVELGLAATGSVAPDCSVLVDNDELINFGDLLQGNPTTNSEDQTDENYLVYTASESVSNDFNDDFLGETDFAYESELPCVVGQSVDGEVL